MFKKIGLILKDSSLNLILPSNSECLQIKIFRNSYSVKNYQSISICIFEKSNLKPLFCIGFFVIL